MGDDAVGYQGLRLVEGSTLFDAYTQASGAMAGKYHVLRGKGIIVAGDGDGELKKQVRKYRRGPVILDMKDIPYIDTVGLGDILNAYCNLSRKGRSLVLCNPTEKVTALLGITKTLKMFKPSGSLDEAVAQVETELREKDQREKPISGRQYRGQLSEMYH